MSKCFSYQRCSSWVIVLTLLLVSVPFAFTQSQVKGGAATSVAPPPSLIPFQRWMQNKLQHASSPAASASHALPNGAKAPNVSASSTASSLFNVPRTYPSGAYTYSAASGDFNGDGIPDVVVANYYNQISVLLGNGDGTFQSPVAYPITGGTLGDEELAVGDFNGDGKLDVIVADQCPSESGGQCVTSAGVSAPGMVSVLLGNGDGTFQAAINSNEGNQRAYAVALGDFNGDGKLDAVVTNELDGTGAIGILLGNGDGTFQAPVSYALNKGGASLPVYVSVGDLNKDGKLDLVVVDNQNNSTVVFLGKGDGTFPTQTTYPAGAGATQPTIGDFNGDGKLDLAVTNNGCVNGPDGCALLQPGSVSIYLGKGDGTFASQVQYPTGYGTWEATVVDFNGDGKLDVAVTNQTDSTLGILLGKGDGTFQAQTVVGAGSVPWSIIAGPFTGGKLPDLIASQLEYSIAVYKNGGTGTVASYIPNGGAGNQSSVGLAADFNGDGKLDVAVADVGGAGDDYGDLPTASGITVMLGQGDGTFLNTAFYPIDENDNAKSFAAGDFRGNGITDLVVGGLNQGSYVFLGNGDGTFQPYETLGSYINAGALAVGDFNNDGHLDIVSALSIAPDAGETIYMTFGNGDGTFQTPTPLQLISSGANIFGIAVADFNNDGNLDLALADLDSTTCAGQTVDNGCVQILLGNGHGSFSPPVNYPAADGPQRIVIGDINGDGKLDMVATNSSVSESDPSGAISVYLGNGDGTFQPQVVYPTTQYSYAYNLQLIDLNGDGKLDLAIANTRTGMGVMLGNGDGTFQPYTGFVAGTGAMDVFAADLNGDGATDLAAVSPFFGNAEAGSVDVLLNTLGGTLSKGSSTTSLTAAPNPDNNQANVVLRATVSAAGGAGVGSVTFQSDGFALGKCTLANGTCTYAASPRGIPGGTYPVTATYLGSSTYLTSQSAAVNVVLAPPTNVTTTTTVSATPNPVTEGSVVELSADVTTTSGSPTGTVQFNYGSRILGSCTLAAGSCTYSASASGIPVGTYSVTAKYLGSDNYLTSVSAPVSVIVESATIVTSVSLTATPNPVQQGASVTLSAVISASSGTATGAVRFLYGHTVLGTCTLASGGCSYAASTAEASPGTYNITASYAGSGNYAASASSPLSIVVVSK